MYCIEMGKKTYDNIFSAYLSFLKLDFQDSYAYHRIVMGKHIFKDPMHRCLDIKETKFDLLGFLVKPLRPYLVGQSVKVPFH